MKAHPTSRRARAAAALLLLGGAALGLAGCPPQPFNPQQDCSGLDTCLLCSSRGGCGWCGNACMPSSAACDAGAIIKSPDLCPGNTPATTK